MHSKHIVLALATALLLPALILALGTGGSVAEPSEQATSWSKGTLDSTNNARLSLSEQLDPEGYVHVSYYSGNNNLMYTSNAGGLWTNRTVDDQSQTGLYNSLAIGKSGSVFISYYDAYNQDLKLAQRNVNDGSWSKSALDQTGDVGKYCSIDIDSNGNGGISYYDSSNEKVKFLSYIDGVGATEVIDDMNSGSTNVVFLANDTPMVTYLEKGTYNLKYAIKEGGSWSYGYISKDTVGLVSSVAVDIHNTVHVAYFDSEENHLTYAKLKDGVWSYAYPDNDTKVSESLSISSDILGSAHISYFNDDDQDLMYASNLGGVWNHEVLDSTGIEGTRNAIAVDYYANVHIVYLDTTVSTDSKLNHISNSLTTWNIEDVSGGISDAGENNTLVVDSRGVKHIAFSDPTNGSLYYANDQSGSWNVSLVDIGGVGQNPDIALDGSGHVYISYYDVAEGHLKMASNSSGVWTNNTIDSSTNNGLYSAIVVTDNGTIYIVYTTSAKNLKFATGISGDFIINLADSSNEVDGGIDMISDSNQDLYVSYLVDSHLWLGRFSGGSWSLSSVDESYECYQTTSIVMRQGGSLVISYFASDGDAKGVRLAFGSTAGWSYQWAVQPNAQAPGFANAVTLFDNSIPLIAYSNRDAPSPLMVSSYYNGIWSTMEITSNDTGGKISAATDPAGSMCILFYDASSAKLRLAVQQMMPSVPLSLTATVGDTFVQLSWSSPQWTAEPRSTTMSSTADSRPPPCPRS